MMVVLGRSPENASTPTASLFTYPFLKLQGKRKFSWSFSLRIFSYNLMSEVKSFCLSHLYKNAVEKSFGFVVCSTKFPHENHKFIVFCSCPWLKYGIGLVVRVQRTTENGFEKFFRHLTFFRNIFDIIASNLEKMTRHFERPF